jgi:HSP20 family protein
MTLPVRRGGPLAERRFPGWDTEPLAEFSDLFGRMGTLLESTIGGAMGPMAEGMAWSPLARPMTPTLSKSRCPASSARTSTSR